MTHANSKPILWAISIRLTYQVLVKYSAIGRSDQHRTMPFLFLSHNLRFIVVFSKGNKYSLINKLGSSTDLEFHLTRNIKRQEDNVSPFKSDPWSQRPAHSTPFALAFSFLAAGIGSFSSMAYSAWFEDTTAAAGVEYRGPRDRKSVV
jgi:hypothetical protein